PDFLATMNAGYQQGTIDLRTIEQDDIDAACAAYPPDRQVQCIFEPRGGFTGECQSGSTEEEGGGCSVAPRRVPAGAALLFGLGLLGLAGLRRRRPTTG